MPKCKRDVESKTGQKNPAMKRRAKQPNEVTGNNPMKFKRLRADANKGHRAEKNHRENGPGKNVEPRTSRADGVDALTTNERTECRLL